MEKANYRPRPDSFLTRNNKLRLKLIAASGLSAEYWIKQYATAYRQIVSSDPKIQKMVLDDIKKAQQKISQKIYH